MWHLVASSLDLGPSAALALGSVFGQLGALIDAPLAGMLKAFYEEFYLAHQPPDARLGKRVESMLKRKTAPPADRRASEGEKE